MQIPERPFDGETPGDGAPSYEWLDEWLCEYVDGTMDPSLEAVFEQYVEANPELKAHVERLRQTRELLCGCDVPDEPDVDPTAEVSTEVEGDLLQSPPRVAGAMRERPSVALGIVSSIAVALLVGFLAGSMLVDPATLSSTPSVSAVDERGSAQRATRTEAPPRAHRGAPAQHLQSPSFSVEEAFAPQPASVPMSGSDTTETRSVLSVFEEQ